MSIDHNGNAYVPDAFEGALKKLVVDRRDPEALVVAKHLVCIANTGVREPRRLCDLTVRAVWVEWHGKGYHKARAFGRS